MISTKKQTDVNRFFVCLFQILGIIFASMLCRNRTEYYDWE